MAVLAPGIYQLMKKIIIASPQINKIYMLIPRPSLRPHNARMFQEREKTRDQATWRVGDR